MISLPGLSAFGKGGLLERPSQLEPLITLPLFPLSHEQ